MNSIARTVSNTIDTISTGKIFSYGDIPAYGEESIAVVNAITRLLANNTIKRLEKGQFYKPKQGILGEIKPTDNELLKTVLFKRRQRKGYITGAALYNQLGLTTQIPQTVTVATNGARRNKDFGTLQVKIINTKAPITESIVTLLQYLDVLQKSNTIPDSDINIVLSTMQDKLAELPPKDVTKIISIALKYYRASTQALTGLLLQRNGENTTRLKKVINPLSTFKLNLDDKQWPEKRSWQII